MRVHAELARREVAALAEVQAYLRSPGFSDTGEGVRQSAEATLALLRRVAPDARLVETRHVRGYPGSAPLDEADNTLRGFGCRGDG